MSSKFAPSKGDWVCSDSRCGNLNFARRDKCNKCGKGRKNWNDREQREIGKDLAEKSKGLFSPDDWQCKGKVAQTTIDSSYDSEKRGPRLNCKSSRHGYECSNVEHRARIRDASGPSKSRSNHYPDVCGNINWARRSTCNVCNCPKVNTQGQRTGYGGGYMERDEVVEYRRRDDSDDEYDEFGLKKKKYRKLQNHEDEETSTVTKTSDQKSPRPSRSPEEASKDVGDGDQGDEEEEEESGDENDLAKYDIWGEDSQDADEEKGASDKKADAESSSSSSGSSSEDEGDDKKSKNGNSSSSSSSSSDSSDSSSSSSASSPSSPETETKV
nr:unnamed protein product [Spirometra erinaceieuropaei]